MLKIKKLSCKVGSFELKDISFELKKGEYLILLGPTGSGKTTFAKCICGINKVKEGKIYLNGKDITNLPPEKRKIGYLPQNFALFPNMNVRENILFSPMVKKINFKAIQQKFESIVEILKINHLLERGVKNLSGGEKQRVALARALLSDPEILILDEPFSSIDVGLKTNLWFEIGDILLSFSIPVIHITHNLDEASVLGQTLAVMIDGKILQKGKKDDVLSKPLNEKIARFLGIRNIYSGEIVEVHNGKITIKGENFVITAFNERNFKKGERVKFSIRPQDIKIIKEGVPVREELKENIFEGVIASAHFLSDTCILKVKSVIDFELKFPSYIYQRHNLHIGKKIKIGIWQKGISVFRE
ncbi:MAG: molybdenum ABC transporter ATP-binding protein [Caldiserica bacterium]|nr:MAG: molybdenum ABC transporter ATP-binding protein [Caldisericota bacterium]